MSGHHEEPTPADPARWRAIAAGCGYDAESMRVPAFAVRDELRAMSLPGAVRMLASLAEGSHAVARIAQADLDAAQLAAAAGRTVGEGLAALFPAEPEAVRATRTDRGWCLDGTQVRSVHPVVLDRAFVVAGTAEGDQLFDVDLVGHQVSVQPKALNPFGQVDPNGPVAFAGTPALPVGGPQWWAQRPEPLASWLHDAACWYGACAWLREALEAGLASRDDPADLVRVGRVDTWVFAARLALDAAAQAVDDDSGSPDPAARTRATVMARRAAAVTATTAETVVRLAAALSDARAQRAVEHDGSLWPSRLAQLQISLRRFDAVSNMRVLGELVTGAPEADSRV